MKNVEQIARFNKPFLSSGIFTLRVVPVRKGITFEIDCGRFRLAFKTNVTLSAGFDFSVLCALMYVYTKGQDIAVRRMSDAFIRFIEQLTNLEESEALADFAKPIQVTRGELLKTARLSISTENLKRLNESIDHFHSIQLLIIDTKESQVRWSSARLVQTAQGSFGESSGKKDDVLQISFNPVLAASCLINPAELEENIDIKRLFIYTKIPLESLRKLDPRNAERYLFAYLLGRINNNTRQHVNHKKLIELLWPLPGSNQIIEYQRIALIKKALDRACEIGGWGVTHQAGFSSVFPKSPYAGIGRKLSYSLSDGFSDFWTQYKPLLRPDWFDRINYMRSRARTYWIKEHLADHKEIIILGLSRYVKQNDSYAPTPLTYLKERQWLDQCFQHRNEPVWWERAGFMDRFDADLNGCGPNNSVLFVSGIQIKNENGEKRLPEECRTNLMFRLAGIISRQENWSESVGQYVSRTMRNHPRIDFSGLVDMVTSEQAKERVTTILRTLKI